MQSSSFRRQVPTRRAAALASASLLLAPLALAAPAAAASPNLVISQVYGGGGNNGATYKNDFIELFNRGTSPVDLTGHSVQYTSSSGTSWAVTNLSGVLEPGRYYLVKEAAGTGGTTDLPPPGATGSITMSATSGKVALVATTTALTCSDCVTNSPTSPIVDFVGYGAANDFEGPAAAPGLSNTTAAVRANGGRTDTDNNGADFTAGTPNPRGSTAPPPPPEPPVCAAPGAAKVSAVQGSGSSTPIAGSTVEVEAVVTADRPGLGGYFVQEEAADTDGNPVTSEGVFVSGTLPAGADEGDLVRVRGTAEEEFRRTRVVAVAASVCAQEVNPAPSAIEVNFPVDSTTYLERHEGMLVRLPQSLVISEYFNFGRFNETVVGLPTPGRDRFDTPTAVVEPGPDARALASAHALRRITLDDGRSSQNPSPPYFPGSVDTPFTLTNTFRGGDTLTGITGALDYSFSVYRIHPTDDAAYAAVNPRPADPPAVGGDVKVASFNVLNYFLTPDAIQDDSENNPADDVCGGQQNLECRGWDGNRPEELGRQRAKIIDAIARLDADVVGLMEMENTPGVEPAADLVAGLNDRLGAGMYSYIDTGVIGTDAIRLGLIYRATTVEPVGTFHVLDSTVDPRFLDTKSRPALAQTFKPLDGNHKFTVAVNHLKSKGSDCNDVNDRDLGDGQGNCNRTRTAAAEALADWLDQRWLGAGDPDRLIIGDLNSYDHEDPIDALVSAGYRDQIKKFGGEYAYGYVFDGQVGYLDHALANESMAEQITGAAEWHINADEPSILDYDTSFKKDAEDGLYEPNAYRSSDHDAVLIGLNLTGTSRNR